jgi:glycosidase
MNEFDPQTPVESYHPGQPLFVRVGEALRDPAFVLNADDTGLDADAEIDETDHGRDNLAPRAPTLRRSPENYDADDFEWSVADCPAGSDGDVLSFATSTTEIPRYDAGRDNVAEFEADAPGRYVLELDAPDSRHQLTIHAFPDSGEGDPARIELDGRYDEAADEFVVESNAELAPGSDAVPADLSVTFLADDRDPLSTGAIDAGERTARVPVEALDDEPARIHAAAHDGRRASVQDVIELHPDGTVSLPNRAPEWFEDAVVYQIFPRSWAGRQGETTFETLIGGGSATGARGVDYLDELGVDAVWLTPVVPAMSAQAPQAPGGPHGYGTLDYFGIAEDLVPEGYDDPVAAYADFVAACNERDIRVLFDLVISHAGRGIDLFQETIAEHGAVPDGVGSLGLSTVREWNETSRTFDWFDRVDVPRYDEDGDVLEARPRATGFGDSGWMPNFNYENVALREYLLAVADFWSREVGVDGFRCDVGHGVPHSLWREIREVVRHNDAEFLMLDETLPNDPAFSESEFDAHFDSYGFTYTAQDVATVDSDERTDPSGLIEDVLARRDQGHPEYSLVLNGVENHDEERLLNQAAVDPENPDDAVSEETWERAATLQRACFAAAVTLPGVPLVYYGQERQISRYGGGRHGGEDDPRGIDDDGGINPESDIRPGGRQRAFMNWEQYDEDHLAFYREMIDLYHDLDALKPGATLDPIELDADVCLFVRDAADLADVDGPETVLVAINFEDDPIRLTVPRRVDGTDLVTGADATTETDADAGTSAIAVDTVGVFALEAPLAGNEVGLEAGLSNSAE